MKQLREIISALQDLNDNWNHDYWIFVGGGTLCLMKKDDEGKVVETYDGGVDQDYIVVEFGLIEADGGGW
jgi:hypothetical protein